MKKILITLMVIVCCLFFGNMNIKATTIQDILDAGEVTLKIVPPTNEDLMYTAMDFFAELYPGYSLFNCNEGMTECDVMQMGQKLGTINILYDYDETIKAVVDKIMQKFGDDPRTFYMNDIEAINYYFSNHDYIVNHPEVLDDPWFDGFALTFTSFSSDLKKFFGYNNFEVRVGYGTDSLYYQEQAGAIEFWYNGTLYGVGPQTAVVLPFVVYIPEDADNVVKAIQDRIGKYFEIESVEIDDSITVAEILANEEADFADYWDTAVSTWPGQNGYSSKEEYVEDMMNIEYLNDDAPAHYLTVAETYRYVVTFENGWATILAVVKDDEKASDSREVITNDAGTGVEIKTEGLIPLDTLIQVARITSGEDYDKIVDILDTTNVEMFDLKLFSSSVGQYITTLDNGTFQVKLPIKDEFKGKDLVVYFVNNNDEVEEFTVTPDGEDYIVFTTNHFSIYTVALANNTNPNTGDNIILYVIIGMVGLLAAIISFNKLRKNA